MVASAGRPGGGRQRQVRERAAEAVPVPAEHGVDEVEAGDGRRRKALMRPLSGVQPSRIAKSSCSMMPSQKLAMARPDDRDHPQARDRAASCARAPR